MSNSPITSGGNGEDGHVIVRGKDNLPLVELVASDVSIINAGNKDHPAQLILADGLRRPTVQMSAADASITAGGGGTGDGKVMVCGKDSQPQIRLFASPGVSLISAGVKDHPAQLILADGLGKPTVQMSAAEASIKAGGGGTGDGKVIVCGKDNQPQIELVASPDLSIISAGGKDRPAQLILADGLRRPTVQMSAAEASIKAGGAGVDGRISVSHGNDGEPGVLLRGSDSSLHVGKQNKSGLIRVYGDDGKPGVQLSASLESVIQLGKDGAPGRLSVYQDLQKPEAILLDGSTGVLTLRNATATQDTIILDGSSSRLAVRAAPGHVPSIEFHGLDGSRAARLVVDQYGPLLVLGESGGPGRICVRGESSDPDVPDAISLDGSDKRLVLTNCSFVTVELDGSTGSVTLKNASGPTVVLDGSTGSVTLKNASGPTVELNGSTGSVTLKNASGPTVVLDGSTGSVTLKNASGDNTVGLNGADGDIWIANADFAEDFDVSVGGAESGTVMVLTTGGQLAPSTEAYDARVVGVISGAGNHRPGMVLDRQSAKTDRHPVALVGKVFCRVDARILPVRVGDLLTTSDLPGHAMRASDPRRAFGAVLGKAMAPLSEGCGLIPILVSLQ